MNAAYQEVDVCREQGTARLLLREVFSMELRFFKSTMQIQITVWRGMRQKHDELAQGDLTR